MNCISIILNVILGAVVGCALPKMTNKMISYKKTKGKVQSYSLGRFNKTNYFLLTVLMIILFIGALYFSKNYVHYVFICIFSSIALYCTIIDYKIRIIPNEMVITVLILGTIYTIIDKGIKGIYSSFIALLLVVIIFALSTLVLKLIFKISFGIGAGDIKMSMAIAFSIGYPDVFIFLTGMAFAMIVYCTVGILLGKLTLKSTFPMCGVLMTGFIAAMYADYITKVLALL